MAPITRAMLLAAGSGTRLRPLTDRVPKPMLPVGGRPLIEHTVRALARVGVREIIVNLHHHPDVLPAHFGDGGAWGVTMRYCREAELLGTSGGVKQAARWLAGAPFFVIYGDNLTTCDFDRLAALHASSRAAVTIALFWKDDVSPHSAVELREGDRIVRFVEKPKREEAPSHWISAGMNVMEPDVLEAIPPGRSDFGFDVFPSLLAAGHRLQGYRMGPSEGLWWIDRLEDYQRVCELWKEGGPPR